MALNYLNAFRSYMSRPGGFARPASVPYGQSIASLYRPFFGGFNVPQGPGGGYTPNPIGPPNEAAPKFGAGTAVGTVKGGTSLAGGGSIQNASLPGSGQGGDPLLQKQQAYANEIEQQAQAAAIAAMKQDLIRFGDPDLVPRVLGKHVTSYKNGPLAGQEKKPYKYADVQRAAANNSFSTTKELDRWNTRQGTGVNESRNQQGLFYSSTRARDLALQGEDFLRQKTAAANALQDAINQIQQQLLAARQQAQGIRISAAGV